MSPPTRRPWSVLVLLSVAQFMVVLDVTVVNVALPSIGADLGFAAADLQWVVTAYVLFTGGLLLLGGRAADLLGRRRVLLAGLVLFTAASAASAAAWSPAALVAARAAQGVGAALLTPAALSILTTAYEGRQRTTALTVWGAIGSAGAAAGMLFGGILTTWLSWEWVFVVNVPAGTAAALLAPRLIPSTRPERAAGRRLDLPGAILVTAGLVTLVYALEGAAENGWGSARTLGLLAASAGLLALFAVAERSSPRPLLPPSAFASRPLVSGSATMLVATGILVGAFFLNSIHLQHALGASALETGLAFLPIAVALAAGAHAAGHLVGHAGSRLVAALGLALTAGAAGLLAAAPADASYAWDLLPGFVVLGLGIGLVFPAASITAMAAGDRAGAGVASGLLSTAHEVGAALGVAVFSAVAASASSPAAGYETAFVAAAAVAAAGAVASLVALPAARPPAGAPVPVH